MFYFRYERKIRGQERETWETLETWCSNEQHKSQYVAALLFVFIGLTQFWFQSFRPWPCINQFFLCCMMSGTRLSVSKDDGPIENSKIYKRMAMILNVVFYFFLFWNSSSIFKTKQNSQSLNVLKISTPIFFLCVFKSLLHRMTAANYRYAKNKMTCLPDFYFFVPGKIINFINLFA